jgi:hypothetical protein
MRGYFNIAPNTMYPLIFYYGSTACFFFKFDFHTFFYVIVLFLNRIKE